MKGVWLLLHDIRGKFYLKKAYRERHKEERLYAQGNEAWKKHSKKYSKWVLKYLDECDRFWEKRLQ